MKLEMKESATYQRPPRDVIITMTEAQAKELENALAAKGTGLTVLYDLWCLIHYSLNP